VLEHLPSPRDMLRENMHDDGGALSAMQLGFTEATRLPEEVEPDENAPRTKVPALFLVTDGERASDRKALVRTFGLYAGPKQLWLLANTAHAPNAFLTYDGEYQQQIAAFLQSALAGSPRVCEATAQKGEVARDQQTWWQMQVTPPPASRQGNPPPRLAIEACAVLADGSAHFARTWSDQATARVRTKLPAPPVCTTAVVVPGAVDDAEAVFRREPTALTRSGASVAALWGRIEDLRNETLAGTAIRALHADLVAAEAKVPFHPLLEAELADVFARIGKELAASQDPAERATGTKLLQRAVAAMPKDPRLHVWPGPTPTYGYPYEDTIEMAKRLLAAPPK
jgi:hypothetical protein